MKFRIADLVSVNVRSLKKNEITSSLVYMDTSSVNEGEFDEGELFNTVQEVPSRARRVAVAGDTIYSTVRPNQHHYGYVTKNLEQNIFSTGFAVLHPDASKVLPYFFYLIMNQKWVTDKLHNIGSGSTSTYPSIKPADILNLEVEIPDLTKQRRIVHFFEVLDTKIMLDKKLNDNLVA